MLKNILKQQPHNDDQKIDDKKKVNEIIQAIFSLKDQCDKTIFQELRFHVPILTTETLAKVITVIEEKSPSMTNDELMFSVDLCTKILSQKSTTPAMIERIVGLASKSEAMAIQLFAVYQEIMEHPETLNTLDPNLLITIMENLNQIQPKLNRVYATPLIKKISNAIALSRTQLASTPVSPESTKLFQAILANDIKCDDPSITAAIKKKYCFYQTTGIIS